jgi:glycogen phosphorylase
MSNGQADLARAAENLASQVPEPLAPLARLAYNYRWSWMPDGKEVFRALDPLRWEKAAGNPVRLLQEAGPEACRRAASDPELLERAAALEAAVQADLDRDAAEGAVTPENPVAYLSAEFAVHASLPIYSGGLGALAGDILKEASDLAIPMVAVGLMYRQGYFRQRIDAWGWQHEYWVDTDPDRVPAALVTGDDGLPITVTVPIRGVDVVAQVWRVDVGRVPLYLLDAERPENDQITRWITSRLYVGDPDTRLAQYILLGVGGMRALRAMGIEPGLLHLNEGHAAFASLELAHQEAEATGLSLEDAFEAARAKTIFTTHTPVPAGNDTYDSGQVAAALDGLARTLGVDVDAIIRRGRTNPDDQWEPFGVTQFALRTSRAANGVSRRHGEVAREMWQGLWPGRPVEEVPIGHVTNGVHVPTWVGAPMRELLERHLGLDWMSHSADAETWAAIDSIPDEELWAVRQAQRAEMVEYVRYKSVADRLARSEPREYVEAAAHAFDPDVLTIGFARRLATYKRLNLLAKNLHQALDLLGGGKTGIQLVLAGKAHPRDDDGKRLVQELFASKLEGAAGARTVFLDDYDLTMAARLVQGCDIWLNLPRPPLEASGTSGMKSAVNGGLQLSVLDGWWAEAYDGENGWALSGDVDHDHGAQDHRHSEELFRLLREEVLPEFTRRDEGGIPRDWVRRVKASLKTNGPGFAAGRMLRDYQEGFYAGQGAAR